jgi:hypothetical protein
MFRSRGNKSLCGEGEMKKWGTARLQVRKGRKELAQDTWGLVWPSYRNV